LSVLKTANVATPMVLIVLAAGTAGYAYFVDRGRVSDSDRAARRTDVFPSFRVDDVKRIELIHGAETLVLDRTAAASADAAGPKAGSNGSSGSLPWAMTLPHRDATDAAAVDVLLRELEMAARVRDVSEGDAKGLDAPRVRGTLEVGSIEYHFALGADALEPAGAAYLRVEGEGTFVVGRSLKVQLLRGADAYRDRTLVPYGANEIARVEVRSPGGGVLTLERTGPSGASFRVGGEHGLRASRTEVDRLFGALADARAETFLDDAVADRAIGCEAGGCRTVVLIPRDPAQPQVRLAVGGACPGVDPQLGGDVVVVRTEPSRSSACVPKGLIEALAATPESLVDLSPFVAHADEMEELRIERIEPGGGGGPRVELARRGGGWHERSPEDRDLDGDEVDSANALVASVAGARALDARHGEPGERFPARSRATIVRTGGGTNEVVEVAAPDASGIALARRIEDGAVLRLPRAAARRFEPHPIALEGGAVWRAPVDPGAVVAVDDSCGRVPGRLELEDGEWKTRGYAVDNLSASDLVESIARARAGAWVSETDDGSFGFASEKSCAVTLSLQAGVDGGGPRRVGVVFGDEGEGGVYARATDGSGVFLAPSALREMASHPAVDRGRFRLDPGSLTRVVLARSGVKLVLSRLPAGRLARLAADVDGGAPDEGDVHDDKMTSALAGLYAECAVHLGPSDADEGFDLPTLEIDTTARGDGGAPVETRIAIGASTQEAASDAYFARVAGVDATFAVPRAVVSAILDAW
jgi:uncharacterized protein DUF4340